MPQEISSTDLDPEVAAINTVLVALKGIAPEARQSVLDYVCQRLDLKNEHSEAENNRRGSSARRTDSEEPSDGVDEGEASKDDALDGVSPVARKWISRSGLSADGLSAMFSLGIEEIDLVATDVPGETKKARMRSVILLKGIAAYLGTGAPRVPFEQVKEACTHYKAYDSTNFAQYLKQMTAEISGTKESGYTLTARGISAATELIREMLK